MNNHLTILSIKKVISVLICYYICTNCMALESLYVGETGYINGPSYNGVMDAISWSSDHSNDIVIYGDSKGATIIIQQYFSGVATVECRYLYHYYIGSKKYNQNGYSSMKISCKKSEVSLNYNQVTLTPGESIKLTYYNSSGYDIPYPYWEINEKNIATIDDYYWSDKKQVTIKGENPGNAIITFYGKTGMENPTCIVTVSDIPVTSLSLSPDTLYIREGDKGSFIVNMTPKNASSAIKWSSSDESIAIISDYGTVTAIQEGSAYVLATTDNGIVAKSVVKVSAQPTSISIDSPVFLYSGYGIKLNLNVIPKNAIANFKWESNLPKIAKVDSSGYVYANDSGEAMVLVKSDNGKSCSTRIIVSQPEEELDYRNVYKRISILKELINSSIKYLE